MQSKISEVVEFCRDSLKSYKNPVLLWSSGKDSTALLHILRTAGINLPLLCFRDPWEPRKWKFADKLTAEWNLTVWNYPPLFVSLLYKKDDSGLVMCDDHECGMDASGKFGTITIPHGVEYTTDGTGTCGREIFERPRCRFSFVWDLGLVGHRDVDVDFIYKESPLHVKVLKREVGPDFCFPLKDWSDSDLWRYLEENDVPMDTGRYDVKNRCEWKDRSLNSDYRSVCLNCLDKRKAGQKVWCPKVKEEIPNISERVPLFHKRPDYFGFDENL